MTIYNLLMALGLVVVVGIVVKGLWSSTRVKPVEQPDNWQGHSGGD
jgi:FtsZ-interacting cell division protein ZipA